MEQIPCLWIYKLHIKGIQFQLLWLPEKFRKEHLLMGSLCKLSLLVLLPYSLIYHYQQKSVLDIRFD